MNKAEAVKAIKEHYLNHIAQRGELPSVEFKHPGTGENVRNGITVPVEYLDAVAGIKRDTTPAVKEYEIHEATKNG